MLERLRHPIVQAPMAGGPSTPELAAAVTEAGGLGFVAAGYLPPERFSADLAATRALTGGPLGVNVFAPTGAAAPEDVAARYRDALAGEGRQAGVELGTPRFDDDWFAEKVEHLCAEPVDAVSFTFGCPDADVIARLRGAGSAVWVTVTRPSEARDAATAGVDALVVQGVEAGGHRGSYVDDGHGDVGLLALLQLVAAETELPLVATGGIATGRAVAAVLVAGAAAAQVGTAFMRCPEAATSAPHRRALAGRERTALTRAFSGRLARGIANRFMADHEAQAPAAYPEVHHITSPLRAHGRANGDADVVNLWAGQAYPLAAEAPAAEVVTRLAREAAEALRQAGGRLG